MSRNRLISFFTLSFVGLCFMHASLAKISPEGREVYLKFSNTLLLPVGIKNGVINAQEKQRHFVKKGEVYVPTQEFVIFSTDRSGARMTDENGDTLPRRDYLRSRIEEQADYIYGNFQSAAFLEKLDPKNETEISSDAGFGSLGESPRIKIYIENISEREMTVRYDYSVRALVNKKLFDIKSKGPILKKPKYIEDGLEKIELEVILPVRLESKIIFEGAKGKTLKACTDHHYDSFDDYWYFFDGHSLACEKQMKSMGKARYYKRANVSIAIRKGEKNPETYPEYAELYKQDEMRIDLFVGLAEEFEWESMTSQRDMQATLSGERSTMFDHKKGDEGFVDYMETARQLTKMGFKRTPSPLEQFTYGVLWDRQGEGSYVYPRNSDRLDEFLSLGSNDVAFGFNYKMEYTKEVIVQQKNKSGEIEDVEKKVTVNLIYTDPSIDSKDASFSIMWKDAMENADIVVYGGHSGLGANLNIHGLTEKMEKNLGLEEIHFKPNKYQILFYNGCSTYGYYNRQYFRKKHGPLNLEIISSGLMTSFGDTPGNNVAMIENFVNYGFDSYNTILKRLENSNTDPVLLILKGEEDNPTDLNEFCRRGVKVEGCN